MMKTVILCFLLVTTVLVQAQVWEDFSDGNLSEDPCWSGDTGHFNVSSSSAFPETMRPGLQLNAPSAGSSGIFLEYPPFISISWNFWIKMSFNSSTNNFAKVILASDRADPSGAFYGYFLQLGGPDDSVRFCRQDSLSVVPLLVLPGLYAGNSTNTFRFLVNRDDTLWSFYADPSGADQMAYQGSVADEAGQDENLFMIRCNYTSSNISKFYFDDIRISQYFPDTIAPRLTEIRPLSSSAIQLAFDEAITRESTESNLNYFLESLGNPSTAELVNSKEVRLSFTGEMTEGEKQTLTTRNISDLFGNISGEFSSEFEFYPLHPWDVVFSEIMADPTPSQGLPEAEYLELFNRSASSLDLGGCLLKMDDGSVEIPRGTIIASREYLLLVPGDLASEFDAFGKVIPVAGLDLANEGTALIMEDSLAHPIDMVSYDKTWYRDDDKSSGGWSLERIDPDQPCLEAVNWTASIGTAGGTPCAPAGFEPSGPGPPMIRDACCLDASTLSVCFDRKMDPQSLNDPGIYSVNHGIGQPMTATASFPDPGCATLTFAKHFPEGIKYTLTVSLELADCLGYPAGEYMEMEFGLPSAVRPADVVINEVLFNPFGDGEDYIELFNRSEHIISFDSLILMGVEERPPAAPDTGTYMLPAGCHSLLPGAYLVVTPDPASVMLQYTCPDPEAIIRMDPFSPLSNTEGRLILAGPDGETIDGMHYQEEMHFPLLTNHEGVALERIYADEPGDRTENWHSASQIAGFGTPGYLNSQSVTEPGGSGGFNISPVAFSPDGDGVDDLATISCHFEAAGWLGSIWIFDSRGRRTRLLVNNELMGTENAFAWDGLTDDRDKADPGVYIVLFESSDLKGNTRRNKKTVALVIR